MKSAVVAGCLLLILLVPGCLVRNRMEMLEIRQAPSCVGRAPGIVIVVDGAGDFLGTTIGVRQAAADCDFPLTIETFEWSHGWCRVLADHLDRDHAKEWGHKLADHILATRAQIGPDVPLYVLAQSGGCPLVLVAADDLPAGVIDRVVMLAPPCSAQYDLSRLLSAVRTNVDVFYSPHDTFILGVCTRVFGTSDGISNEPAGRVSFYQPVGGHADDLYCKLRQHKWRPAMKKVGYDGRHLSCNKSGFIKDYVLPLFPDECEPPLDVHVVPASAHRERTSSSRPLAKR